MAEGRGVGALLHVPPNSAVYKWVNHGSSLSAVRALWECSNGLFLSVVHQFLFLSEKFDPSLSPKLPF